MCMKYSWYSGLATVVFRISGNFPNLRGINKGFLDLPKKGWSPFFSPTPENLDNSEKNDIFRIIGGFQCRPKKMKCRFGIYTPKKFIKKRKKNVFFLYIHKVKYIIPIYLVNSQSFMLFVRDCQHVDEFWRIFTFS